jgi:hypothetical protein
MFASYKIPVSAEAERGIIFTSVLEVSIHYLHIINLQDTFAYSFYNYEEVSNREKRGRNFTRFDTSTPGTNQNLNRPKPKPSIYNVTIFHKPSPKPLILIRNITKNESPKKKLVKKNYTRASLTSLKSNSSETKNEEKSGWSFFISEKLSTNKTNQLPATQLQSVINYNY